MLTNNNTPLEKRIDLHPSEMKMWRTLIRIDSADFSTDKTGFVIPGWDSDKTLYFDIQKIPEKLIEKIKNEANYPIRFHAYVNKGAERVEDIYITFLDNL